MKYLLGAADSTALNNVYNNCRYAPIHLAGKVDILTFLLDQCTVDPNLQSKIQHYTVLHIVVPKQEGTDWETVKFLLGVPSVNVNRRDNYGRTALHYTYPSYPRFHTLLDHGADVNCKDNDGRTPLHHAFTCKETKLVVRRLRLLLRAPDIDINCRDSMGRTPLHCAALSFRTSNEKCIEMLLGSPSIDVNALDNSGYMPLDYALGWLIRIRREVREVKTKAVDIVKEFLAHDGISSCYSSKTFEEAFKCLPENFDSSLLWDSFSDRTWPILHTTD